MPRSARRRCPAGLGPVHTPQAVPVSLSRMRIVIVLRIFKINIEARIEINGFGGGLGCKRHQDRGVPQQTPALGARSLVRIFVPPSRPACTHARTHARPQGINLLSSSFSTHLAGATGAAP
jgi:hypothetical protein